MITKELKEVILRALKLDDWDLADDTVASEVPGWDSLSHVNVILAVEEHYAVRFTSRQVLALKTVGDLQQLVNARLEAKG